MPVLVDYPPPPEIDFNLSDDPKAALKEMNEMLDACSKCEASEAAVRVVLLDQKWQRIYHSGPSSEVFRSPSNLKLYLSIRSKKDFVTVRIGSQDKRLG